MLNVDSETQVEWSEDSSSGRYLSEISDALYPLSHQLVVVQLGDL